MLLNDVQKQRGEIEKLKARDTGLSFFLPVRVHDAAFAPAISGSPTNASKRVR
jgi:hypothetical protein